MHITQIEIIIAGIVSCILLFQTIPLYEESIKTTIGSSASCKAKGNRSKCASKHAFRKSSKYRIMMTIT